jgi:hypothetical protein
MKLSNSGTSKPAEKKHQLLLEASYSAIPFERVFFNIVVTSFLKRNLYCDLLVFSSVLLLAGITLRRLRSKSFWELVK